MPPPCRLQLPGQDFLLPIAGLRQRGLTLVLPEDPRAHELEEAAGVKPRPVHGDGVLRRGGGHVRARQAVSERQRVGGLDLRRRRPAPSRSAPASS